MKNHFDMLIVGAGPAGSFAAYKLSRAGFKVLVIDRNPPLTHKVCGEYLCPKGVQLIENEGLAQRLLTPYLSIFGMNIFSPKGRQVRSHFPNSKGMSRGLSLNRKQFDHELVLLAEAHGAQFHFGESLENFVQNENGVTIKTDQNEYVANILIGADGRKSRVASLLGVTRKIINKRVAIHAELTLNELAPRVGEMHLFADGSYAGIDPIGPKTYNFSVVCDPQHIKDNGGPQNTLTHYIAQSEHLREKFAAPVSSSKISTANPLSHSVTQVAKGHVALVGDAAGFIDPLTGEGIFNALYSSQLLSEKLIEARDEYSSSIGVIQHSVVADFIQHTALVRAIEDYAFEHKANTRAKANLNTVFQTLIRIPFLIEGLAMLLATKTQYADIFIGIVGNIYTPFEGLKQLFSSQAQPERFNL